MLFEDQGPGENSSRWTPAGAGVGVLMWTPLRPEEAQRIERRLLGIMLERPETISAVETILGPTPSVFGRHGHGEVYRTLLGLGSAADAPLVLGRLSDEAKRSLERPASYLTECQELAFGFTTKAQAEHQARIIRSSQHVRSALVSCQSIVRAIESGEDPSASLPSLATSLDMARADDTRIVPLTQAELCAMEIVPPDSILGDGLFAMGEWGYLHAREGLGKTWLLTELAVCLASGRPWFGIPVSRRFRVGIASFEMGRYRARSRMERVIEGSGLDEDANQEIRKSIWWITKDECPVLDLTVRSNQAWIADWCAGEGIEVLILDPMAQIFFGDENSRESVAPLLTFLQTFPSMSGGCTPFMAHHDRKQSQQGDQGDHASAGRGSIAISGSTRCSFRLIRKGEGQGAPLVLICDKANEGPKPAEIWIKQEENGRLSIGKNPSTKADQLREGILEYLSQGDAYPEEMAEKLGRQKRIIETRLRELETEGLVYPKRVKPEGQSRWRNLWTAIGDAQTQNCAKPFVALLDEEDNPYVDHEMPF